MTPRRPASGKVRHMRYAGGPRPRLFGHRGAAGEVPENTLASFATALAVGADRLELDVHCTADGAVVVLHDPTLDRTTEGHGPVAASTLAEVRTLDAGYRHQDATGATCFRGTGLRVPTLDEVLESFPEAPLNVEIKPATPSIEAAVIDVLTRHNALDRVLLAAEEGALMQKIRAAAPGAVTGFAASEVMAFVTGSSQRDYRSPGFALQVPTTWGGMDVVTPDFISAAHRHGVEVHVWTVNTEAEIDHLLELGVDGIITDLPTMAYRVFVRRGLR